MKRILLSFIIIFSLTFSYNASSGYWFKKGIEVAVAFVINAYKESFNPSTGKTDVKKLRDKLDVLGEKMPEMQRTIDDILVRVGSNTSLSEYKSIVNIEMRKLSERVDKNEINIVDLYGKIEKLNKRMKNEDPEIEESRGRRIILNYLSHASRILNMASKKKEENMNLLWHNLLSDRMKKKLPLNSFKAWWGKTVNTLSYGSITYTDRNIFDLEINYGLKNGSSICKVDQIFFIKEFGRWKIHDMLYGEHVECR